MKTGNTRAFNYAVKHNGSISEVNRRKYPETIVDYFSSYGQDFSIIGNVVDLYNPMSTITFETRELAENCPYAIAVVENYDNTLHEMEYLAFVPTSRIF